MLTRMTSLHDPSESVRNRTSRQITLPYPPTVRHRAAVPIATRVGSDYQPAGVPQSVHADQQAYLARRRISIALVSLVLLGSVLLIGKAVTIHLERIRSASATPAPQASESRVDAVIASGTAVRQAREQAPVASAVEPSASTSDSEATRGASAVKLAASGADRSTTSVVSNRRAAPSDAPRRLRAAHTRKSQSFSQSGAESGIPVDQIYVNPRGDLVDAEGKLLHSDSSSAKPATSDDATSAP